MDIDLTNHHKTTSPKKNIPKKRSIGNFILTIFTILVVGFGAWLYWQKQEKEKSVELLNKSISNIENQLSEKNDGQTLKSLAEAERILDAAAKYRTEWSQIMAAILFYETPNIQFGSFSIEGDGLINISGQAKSIKQIKNLIAQLENSPTIKNPFISTISQSSSGVFPARFQLSFKLVE